MVVGGVVVFGWLVRGLVGWCCLWFGRGWGSCRSAARLSGGPGCLVGCLVLVWLLNGCPPAGGGALGGVPGPLRGWCVVRRSPTLPHAPACSTIGAGRLNFRVRYGTGCFPSAMATGTACDTGTAPVSRGSCPCVQNNTVDASTSSHEPAWPHCVGGGCVWQASRPFGIGQLHASRRFHVRPINPVVCRGPYQHGAGESSS